MSPNPNIIRRIGITADVGIPILLGDTLPNMVCLYAMNRGVQTATRSVRIRRSSDNAEQDIGFDFISFDAAAAAAFIGAGDGFATTFYNQIVANEDLVRSGATTQPELITDVLQGDGSDDYMDLDVNTIPTTSGDFTICGYIKSTTVNSDLGVPFNLGTSGEGTGNVSFNLNDAGGLRYFWDSSGGDNIIAGSTGDYTDTNPHWICAIRRGGTMELYVDDPDTAVGTSTSNVAFTTHDVIANFARLGGTFEFEGQVDNTFYMFHAATQTQRNSLFNFNPLT